MCVQIFVGFNAEKPLEKQLLTEDHYESKMKAKYNFVKLAKKFTTSQI